MLLPLVMRGGKAKHSLATCRNLMIGKGVQRPTFKEWNVFRSFHHLIYLIYLIQSKKVFSFITKHIYIYIYIERANAQNADPVYLDGMVGQQTMLWQSHGPSGTARGNGSKTDPKRSRLGAENWASEFGAKKPLAKLWQGCGPRP